MYVAIYVMIIFNSSLIQEQQNLVRNRQIRIISLRLLLVLHLSKVAPSNFNFCLVHSGEKYASRGPKFSLPGKHHHPTLCWLFNQVKIEILNPCIYTNSYYKLQHKDGIIYILHYAKVLEVKLNMLALLVIYSCLLTCQWRALPELRN